MANEPTLRKTDIEELEDRVTILEGGTPEPHSNTMTKPELEDLEDRITVLEGGTPGEHSNPMRFEFFTSVEDRVEELEEEDPTKAILVVDFNGGKGAYYEDHEYVERFEKTYDKGTLITLLSIFDCTFNPPQGYSNLIGFTYVKDDSTTMVPTSITLDKNTTIYALWKPSVLYTLTYNYNGATDEDGHTSERFEYESGTVVDLIGDPTKSSWVLPEGKVFGHWSSAPNYDYGELTEITMNEDKTVYATWVDKEPNLIPITVDDELEGFWIKPRVELDPTDPLVSQAYTYISDKGPMGTEFILSSCASGGGTTAARIIFDSDSDSYTHQTIFNDAAINILYKRVETDASISGNDIYELNGIAEIDGTEIDLSTITRPIYISISNFFTDPITLLDSGTPASCDALSCKFFFKEDGSR